MTLVGSCSTIVGSSGSRIVGSFDSTNHSPHRQHVLALYVGERVSAHFLYLYLYLSDGVDENGVFLTYLGLYLCFDVGEQDY